MGMFWLSLKYARRELRGGFKGVGVFLACLILGVASIAAVQSVARGLIESLRYDGRYILGGDLALSTVYQPATAEQLHYLRKNIGPVNTVMETRAMARKEGDTANANQPKSVLVELKAVDPFYPMYGSLAFADADGKPMDANTQDLLLPKPHGKGEPENDDWGAVVEKELMTQMHLKLGDSILIGKRSFIVRAVITKEPDRISRARFSLAPRVMISSYIFDATGLSERGNQVYYDHRLVVPYVHTPAEMQQVEDQITKAFPDATWKGRTCFNATPQIERLIGQLTEFMTLIGLATLLVGGVGISNSVRSFLTSKLTHIAMLKCLGAPGKLIFSTYLVMILCLTVVGVLLGVGLGAYAADVAETFLTARLELTNHAHFYPDALVLAGLFGLLTSLCFSLWPLGRTMNIHPRQLFRDILFPVTKRPSFNVQMMTLIAVQMLALVTLVTSSNNMLALFFIAGAGGTYLVFYLYAELIKAVMSTARIERLLGGTFVRRMALSNLYRPGNLTNTVILSLGLGLTVLTAVALVESNFSRLIQNDMAKDTPSFFFLDVKPDQVADFETAVQTFPGAHDLLVTPSLRGRIVRVGDKTAEEALVDPGEAWVIQSDRGFTYTPTLPAYSRIVAGDWWKPDYQGPPIVSIATDVARAFNIGVGDKITVNIMGVDITATVANVREVTWSSFTMNFAVTFAPGFLEKIPAMRLATVALDPGSDEIALQNAISDKFPNVTIVRVKAALETAGTFTRAIAQAVRIAAGLTLVTGIFVLAGSISAARQRYIYDAVVLKVLGARRAQILACFLMEYGLLSALTMLIAAGLGALAAWAVLVFIMKLTWTFSFPAIASVVVLAFILTTGAGYIGTRRALQQKPATQLRNQ